MASGAETEARRCAVCGGILVPRAAEAPGAFRRRRTCSRACWRRQLSRAKLRGAERTSAYSVEWQTLREAIKARDGHQCQRCGRRRLHVHHVDHDRGNDDPTNLVTLCPRCHAAVHRVRPADTWAWLRVADRQLPLFRFRERQLKLPTLE